MKWLLIFFVLQGGTYGKAGGAAVATFDDLPACEAALAEIKSWSKGPFGVDRVRAMCAPSASPAPDGTEPGPVEPPLN